MNVDKIAMACKAFHKALNTENLIGSECRNCGFKTLPQRRICPACHEIDCETITFSGHGKLSAFTIIYVPTASMLERGYDAKNPYCVGIVKLVEGPSVMAQILDVDLHQPENIKIGMELTTTFIMPSEGEEESAVLAFVPSEKG